MATDLIVECDRKDKGNFRELYIHVYTELEIFKPFIINSEVVEYIT